MEPPASYGVSLSIQDTQARQPAGEDLYSVVWPTILTRDGHFLKPEKSSMPDFVPFGFMSQDSQTTLLPE